MKRKLRLTGRRYHRITNDNNGIHSVPIYQGVALDTVALTFVDGCFWVIGEWAYELS